MPTPVDLSPDDRALLVQMLRVVFPHDRFPDGPYERTADAVVSAASTSPQTALTLTGGLRALNAASFAGMDEPAATTVLKSLETGAFFGLVRSTAVVSLYDDAEVWTLLGYEGAAFDQGGYVNRGFDDLDWLPDPRITEYEAPEDDGEDA